MVLRRLVISVLTVAFLTAAAGEEERLPRFGVGFVPDGAVLRFDRPTKLARIELSSRAEDGAIQTLSVEQLHERPITRHRLFFKPEDRPYLIRIVLGGGNAAASWHRPSPEALCPVSMVLQVPYRGEQDITRRWGRPAERRWPPVAPGAAFTAEVEIMPWSEPVTGELQLVVSDGFELAGEVSGCRVSKDSLGRTVLTWPSLSARPMETIQLLVPLRVGGPEVGSSSVSARFTPSAAAGMPPVEQLTVVSIVSVEQQVKNLRTEAVLMPTDAQGRPDVRKPRDTLMLPSRLGMSLRRALGLAEPYADYYAPSTFQTLRLVNTGATVVPLAVSTRVTRIDDNAAVPGFRPPDYLGGTSGVVTVTAEVAPQQQGEVVLPVFTRPAELLPGRYHSIIEVRILGTDTVVRRLEHPFQVRRVDLRALLVTLAAVLLSLGGLALFLLRQRRIFGAFRISELVLIALFATMTFVLVILPGSILQPVFSAVAGPFGFLIQGIFFEVLRFLMMVTLLVLVPRVGTVTLVSLVRYLIGGLALGGFTPVDVFYLGASVVLLEGVLYFAGVTSKKGVLRREKMTWPVFLHVAVVCGLVNGVTQYVIYCLNISFYRLYFADWFIWLAVGVYGFLYAVLGTIPGIKLGLRLRRVSE